MKERSTKVLALIPLNLDGFLFKCDERQGGRGQVSTRCRSTGWRRSNTRFERRLRALYGRSSG